MTAAGTHTDRRLRFVGWDGFWWRGRRWDVSYWTPWTWKPLFVRDDARWWGALRVERVSRHG